MKRIFLTVTLILSIESSFACLNEYRTLLTGDVVFKEPSNGKIWNREIDTLELRNKSNELLEAYKRSDSLEFYSDYAAALTYLGEYQKAKKIYEEIEQLTPKLYTTASNLGTIYELTGKPDSAIIWIKKSIELNPMSHYGSEWVHVKILEYKISKSTNKTSSILGLDFGSTEIPSNPNNYKLEELRNHIWHQLRERTTFVKPKNNIVGNIYFDLGNVLAQTSDVQAALESYAAAKEYGFESELMDNRIQAFEKLALKAKPDQFKEDTKDVIRDNIKVLAWSGLAAFIGLILLIAWLIRRKIKNKVRD